VGAAENGAKLVDAALASDVGKKDGDHGIGHAGHDNDPRPLFLWTLLFGGNGRFGLGAGLGLVDALDGRLTLSPLLAASRLARTGDRQKSRQEDKGDGEAN